jgi:hypothetical protein
MLRFIPKESPPHVHYFALNNILIVIYNKAATYE